MEGTQKNTLLGYLLLFALVVVFIQVVLGGITRLTGSGLSITKWDLVTGTLPPLNESDWQAEFEHYQATPQYREINQGMSLSQFKWIYFWEWFHRLWGRWGFALLLGIFATLAIRRRIAPEHLRRFIPLLLLYAAQGALGWFMVKSGLSDIPRVSHYRLTSHLLLAILLFAYILWFAADVLTDTSQKIANPSMRRYARWLVALVIIQIAFGGFMSGLRAAAAYPSFPTMNGQWLPDTAFALSPFWYNFFENPATIHLVHRNLAYVIAILIALFWYRYRRTGIGNPYFTGAIYALPVLVLVQISLGASVLLLTQAHIPVVLGVIHQAVGLLLLSTLLFVLFQSKPERSK